MKGIVTQDMLAGFLEDEGFEVVHEYSRGSDYVHVALYDENRELLGLANLRSFNYPKFGEHVLAHATDGGGPAKVVVEVKIDEPDSLDRLVRALREWRPPPR